MTNGKKKLQKMATKFRRENPALHNVCCVLTSRLSSFIKKTGSSEATVGLTTQCGYYEYAND